MQSVPICRPEEGTDPSFVCERVCTSDRLLRRMGGLSKDPTPNTCVTVCGVGGALFPHEFLYLAPLPYFSLAVHLPSAKHGVTHLL